MNTIFIVIISITICVGLLCLVFIGKLFISKSVDGHFIILVLIIGVVAIVIVIAVLMTILLLLFTHGITTC